MLDDQKIERELKKHYLLTLLIKAFNSNQTPPDIRVLAGLKCLEIFDADDDKLDRILEKFKNILDDEKPILH